MSNKPHSMKVADEITNEATECRDLSVRDLSLLTSGLAALRKAHEKPLNDIEMQAICSMITYVAYNQKVDETTVCEILTAHFDVSEVKALPSLLYQNAIEFLVDLEMKKLVN